MTFEGAIGIDLGTTYSCVAVLLNDHVEIIANDQGNRTTPSVVAFHNDDVLVGDAAKNLAARGVGGVVYDAKRMIGRRYSDAVLQRDCARWPFVVVEGAHDAVEVQVPFRGTTHRFTPEQISAYVLLYLKECAERYLGARVRDAVITVPAYFADAQRERTKAAAAIADLHVVRIVNEPTAAALCYGLGIGSGVTRAHVAASIEQQQQQQQQQSTAAAAMQNVVVFDFGGGTFDVSVITVDGSSFAVRATAGDTHLGGQDIDDNLVSYVVDDLRARCGVDLTTSSSSSGGGSGGTGDSGNNAAASRQLAKVRAACERAKRVLSHATSEELVVDGVLPDGAEYTLTLSRAKFDELNADVYARCMSVVDAALRDAHMTAEEADVVILVGGSSRIVRVQELLRARFRDGVVRNSVHPDEAVAMGAAVQASILSTAPAQHSSRTEGVVLMDVVPLSIGVEVDDGKCDVLIPRNTTIPYRVTKEYTTVEDHQRDVDIVVYEGEHKRTRHNHKLGEFALEGITRARKGDPTITVTFSINADGLLTITASEALAQATRTLVVQNAERLSDEEVRRLGAQVRGLRKRDADASNRLADATTAAATQATRTRGKKSQREGSQEDKDTTHKRRRGSTKEGGAVANDDRKGKHDKEEKKSAAAAAAAVACVADVSAASDRVDDATHNTTDDSNGDDDARVAAAVATLEAVLAAADADVAPHVRTTCEQLLSHAREWRRRKLPKYTDAHERRAKVDKVLERLARATRHARKRTQRGDSHDTDEADKDASSDDEGAAASAGAGGDKDGDASREQQATNSTRTNNADDSNNKEDEEVGRDGSDTHASQAKQAHLDTSQHNAVTHADAAGNEDKGNTA